MPRPISLEPVNCHVHTVTDLRNSQGDGWDITLLQQLFTPTETSIITKTVLSASGTKDRLIWKHSIAGQYDVNSGYKFLQKMKRQRAGCEGTSSSVEDHKTLWNFVWKLNVKKKIHHFCGNALIIAFQSNRIYRKEEWIVAWFVLNVEKALKLWNMSCLNVLKLVGRCQLCNGIAY